MLKIAPDSEGKPLSGDVDELLAEREAIEEYLNNRLSSIRTTHKKGEFEQGGSFSKEQETLIQYLQHIRDNSSGKLHEPVDEIETVSECAEQLRNQLTDVKLKNTDEDRILRERFRDHPEHDRISEWPVEELFNENRKVPQRSNREFSRVSGYVGESQRRSRAVALLGIIGGR